LLTFSLLSSVPSLPISLPLFPMLLFSLSIPLRPSASLLPVRRQIAIPSLPRLLSEFFIGFSALIIVFCVGVPSIPSRLVLLLPIVSVVAVLVLFNRLFV